MKRTTEILTVNFIGDVPTIDSIQKIPRSIKLKLVFTNATHDQRQAIGEKLKKELSGFIIGIHTMKPEINIAKLITDNEIESNQSFFENCAKDYYNLSYQLISKLAEKFNLIIDPQSPIAVFNPLKGDKRQKGRINGWYYFLHGAHCGFENMRTKQIIETPLIYGVEFGALDPYFFTRFIRSTSSYNPLPVDIYEEYEDGVRINDVMTSLGKFKKIRPDDKYNKDVVLVNR